MSHRWLPVALVTGGLIAVCSGATQHGPKRVADAASAEQDIVEVSSVLPWRGYSIAAVNLSTGATLSDGATNGMVTASVVKIDLLETLLLRHQTRGTTLSAGEDRDATSMIENSDNGAAENIFNDIGGAVGLNAANPALGASISSTVPGPSDYWGLTTTSAYDQVQLLRDLVTESSPLGAPARTYALTLLANVKSDQAWGVPAAAHGRGPVEVKDGWLSVADDGGRWAVNSDGIITIDGQRILISVLTQHDRDERTGIDLVEALAEDAAAIVT